MFALVLGAGFWIQRIGVNDLDDAASNEVIFARQPLATLLFDIRWPDQSPLYFVVLHLWRRLGESSRALAILQLALLSLGVVLLHRLALRLFRPRAVADAAALLAALSPASLWLVRNGRMYPLQVVLFLFSALCLVRFLEVRRPRDLLGFAIASVLGIYNHFFALLVTGCLILWLCAELALEAKARHRAGDELESARPAPRGLLQGALLCVLVIVLAAVPQASRMLAFVQEGGQNLNRRSLPGLSLRFLHEVSAFWLVNAQTDTQSPPLLVSVLYFAIVYGLVAFGTALGSRRFRLLVLGALIVPLLALGLAAFRVDLRPRYFIYMLPLIWMATANAAWGAPEPGALPPTVRAARALLFAAVASGSTWFVVRKLPERYPEWTKLMSGLQRLDRPGMAVYMPPGDGIGSPIIVAENLGLEPALRRIQPLTPETRPAFLSEADAGREFVFLVQWDRTNRELDWRAGQLAERGYHSVVLPVWGAQARLFTHQEPLRFTLDQRVLPNPSPAEIVRWARGRLADKVVAETADLARALVARVDGEGLARESVFFMSQHGEDGYWRLAEQEWNAVQQALVTSGRVSRRVILAQVARESTLVLGFPGLATERSLRFACGISDADLRHPATGDVAITAYLDDDKVADLVCQNAPGWREVVIDTSGRRAPRVDVTLLVTTEDDRPRAFGLGVETSRARPGPAAPHPAPGAAMALTGARTLEGWLPDLRVYRIGRDGSQWPARALVTGTVAARDMHERSGAADEGALGDHWVLGPEAWDSVGHTRQRSGGGVRSGLWAHPKDGTVLVIAADKMAVGTTLEGYFGITDFSLEQAVARGVSTPVSFTVFLDEAAILREQAPREPGWRSFSVSVPGGGEHRLRVEVAAARDSWAHFVFDLWSK